MPLTSSSLVAFAPSLLPFVLGADPGALYPKSYDRPRLTHVHPDSIPSSASSSPSPVSWQSACLGLVPLALNAMTQPSSLDAPLSQSSLLFASRSSPFICLADTLEIIISLVIHGFHGKSPSQAALLVNWQRARHRLGEDVDELEDIPAEKHPWGFVILLVAAVLQAVKILSFKGLFWTKLWAGVYLSSYMLIAVVGFLAPKDWRDRRSEIVSSRRSSLGFATLSQVLLWSALGAHFVCCSWILDRIIAGDSAPLRIPFLYVFLPLIVQVLTSAWITTVLAGSISSAPWLLLCWLFTVFDPLGDITWNLSRRGR